jgi:hypothetical protein
METLINNELPLIPSIALLMICILGLYFWYRAIKSEQKCKQEVIDARKRVFGGRGMTFNERIRVSDPDKRFLIHGVSLEEGAMEKYINSCKTFIGPKEDLTEKKMNDAWDRAVKSQIESTIVIDEFDNIEQIEILQQQLQSEIDKDQPENYLKCAEIHKKLELLYNQKPSQVNKN